MQPIHTAEIYTYREHVFHTEKRDRLKSIDQAVELINKRGLLAFWPVKDIPMPSLWAAVAGNRPVPNEHDDPGHISWDWKDRLLGQRKCYYARILCKRTFFVSLDLLPNLYALSNNFGSYEEDHIIQYESGKLSNTAYAIYQTLLERGPLDTIELHRLIHSTGQKANAEFNRALDELQMDFKVLPVGISPAGRWHYAMIFDIVARHLPEVVTQAGNIAEGEAREKLLLNYLASIGAARRSHVQKLFHWEKTLTDRTIERLVHQRLLYSGLSVVDSTDTDWLAIPELVLE